MGLILSSDVGRPLTSAEIDSNNLYLQTIASTQGVTASAAAGQAVTSAATAQSSANTAATTASTTANTNVMTAVSTVSSAATTGAAVASAAALSAQTFQNNAASSAISAGTSLAAMNKVWLGSLAADPSIDLNGNAVAAGCAYFNTVLLQFRTYNGTTWQTGFTPTDSSTMNFQQLGTGALARTAQSKFRDIVNVLDFSGIDPTGTTDSYAGFVNAVAYCTTNNYKLIGAGTFILSSKLVISCDCDLWNATFNLTGTNPIGLEVSTGNASNPTTNIINKSVVIGNVVNITKPATGWASQGTGVRLVNLINCDIKIRQITGFAVGLLNTAYQTGSAYSQINVLYYNNNGINLKVQPGYTNENVFYAGRYAHNSTIEGTNIVGTRHIQLLPFDITNASLSWPNNNVFIKPSVENDVAEYHIEIGGYYNTVSYGRFEATSPKVLYTGHSTNNAKTQRNLFLSGYQTDLITFTTTGVSAGNTVFHTRKFNNYGFNNGMALTNTGGDVQTTPHARGYSYSQNFDNAQGTDVNWAWNLYTGGIQGKLPADAYERVRLDFTTGRVYMGAGTATPTKYVGGAGSFLNFSIDIVPTADNTYGVGYSTLRWSTVYAGTGTINTSDEREKQDIAEINDSVLDAWEEVEFVQYRWKDAVVKKGDSARIHTGLIAQRVQDCFQKHGLDAFNYGLLCYDKWEDHEVEGTLIPAGDRWGIRADECLFLEAALMRRTLKRLKNNS